MNIPLRLLSGLLLLPVVLAAETSVKVTPLRDGVFMMENKGGVMAVLTGKDGPLLVDSQYAEGYEAVRAAVAELTGQSVRTLINTHFHLDHTGGNQGFGEAGAVIFAQLETRRLLESPQYLWPFDLSQEAFVSPAIPGVTFPDRIILSLNGQTVEVTYPGPAHTGGDAIVFFHQANIVHVGDVFVLYTYPFIDTTHGGSLPGTIAACEALLPRVDDETLIITGHGGLARRSQLIDFIEMLKVFESRLRPLVDEGLSLEEIVAAQPLGDYEATSFPAANFIRLAVEEMRGNAD